MGDCHSSGGRLQRFLRSDDSKPSTEQQSKCAPPAPAPANDPNGLQEKMKNGEDIPEPMLILIGVDPAEYKKRQEEIRKAKLEQELKPAEEANPRPNQ